MKRIVITGATSGIGKEVARQIMKLGHLVISNSRNMLKSDEVKDELSKETGNKNIFFYEGDFSSFKSVRNFAGQIKNEFPGIDVLINNAGIWEVKFIETADGIETNLQVNHLSPMLLTLELIPVLEESGNPRVVNTSSGAHRRDILDLKDPEWRSKTYDGIATYSQSKLMNILFSLHLIKLLRGKNFTINTVHPGYIKTSLFDKMGQRDWTGVPDAGVGASGSVYTALSPLIEGISGKYIFHNSEDPNLSDLAQNEEMASKVWEMSLEFLKLKNPDMDFHSFQFRK